MNVILIKKLTELGVIKHNTEIEAEYKGVDMSGSPVVQSIGNFFVQSVKINKDRSAAIFGVTNSQGGDPRTVLSNDVLKIDGMSIEALASIYGIAEDGGKLVQGKRRGRRPRDKSAVAA